MHGLRCELSLLELDLGLTMNRLTWINGFHLNGKPLTNMQVVDKYNELKAAHDKLKSGTVAFYENQIKELNGSK